LRRLALTYKGQTVDTEESTKVGEMKEELLKKIEIVETRWKDFRTLKARLKGAKRI